MEKQFLFLLGQEVLLSVSWSTFSSHMLLWVVFSSLGRKKEGIKYSFTHKEDLKVGEKSTQPMSLHIHFKIDVKKKNKSSSKT